MIKRKTFIKGTIIGLFSIFLASCSENDMRERVRALAQSSELSTVEYTITKVIKANDEAFYTIGDRKILFSCKAIVKAGVNLANFNEKDITINDSEKAITIMLPAPEVLSFNMPIEDAEIVYQKVGTLRLDFTAEQRNDLLRQGEEDIKADLERLGVLKDAEENTKMFFEAVLQQLGYKNINIIFKKNRKEAKS